MTKNLETFYGIKDEILNKFEILKKHLIVRFPNGDKFKVPIRVIAYSRADYYKDEYENDINRSLDEDTAPLFSDDGSDISDWFQNNMHWSDVAPYSIKMKRRKPTQIYYDRNFCNASVSETIK